MAEEGIRAFIASFSDLSPKGPNEGGVVPLIAPGQADASIATPHHVTAQFVFVNGTLAIEPTNFTEVLVPVKGSCEVTVDGEALHLELFDALSVDGGGARHLRSADQSAVLLRSEENTSELQSLMRISYAVYCLKQNTKTCK